MRLIQNQLRVQDSSNLVVAFKQSYEHQMAIALVVHSLVAIRCAPKHYLRDPLEKLLYRPREMRVSVIEN